MRMHRLISFAAACAVTAFVGTATADVIDFDDLIGQQPVPNGYGGVADWSTWTYYDWSQPPYNPKSPPCRVYTNSGRFSFGREVIFNGAWFAGHGTSRGFLPISFDLYLNNQLVHSSGQIDLLSDGVPTWLDSGYSGGVDTVQVRGSHGFYVMDDVTWEEAGGYRLSVGGQCPGRVTVDWRGATPNRTQGLVFGASQGSTTIPGGACQGTVLGVQGQVRLVNSFGTGPNGSGSTAGNAGTGACGAYLQLIEVPSCNLSNVGQIP